MALTYGFYNSVEGDRTYDAIQMGQIFDGIITDGVYATFLKAMVVKASDNPSEVIVQPGRCWFNHTWTYIDADYPVTTPAPEVILDRVDALVIDINTENAFRENSLVWVQGTPSSLNPERPTLIKSVTHNQYPLCYVYRKAGTTMVYAADITNAVGTSETPFVTGVLQGINIDDLLAQWDDEFHTWEAATKTSFESWMVNQQSVYVTWFNSIKDQMEGDLTDFEAWFETIKGIIDEEAATHLQAEIDELKDMLPAGSHIDISTVEPTLFNRNVTVSDGVHSKTVQFDSVGGATVESFPYIGIISVTSTDGTRTAEESINIPYFGRYSAVLAFWSATVNLVGDGSLAALPVTVRDSNGDVVAIVTLNASGQGVFTATKPDEYKFIYTYGGKTMEVSLAVTQETTYEVELHGGFRFDIWLEAGRVEEEFDTLDEVLADESTLRQLFLVHDSVDYICNTFSESATSALADITKIFNTDLAAKWITLSDYALDHFYAIEGIKSIMDTADKYGYGEWALMPQVPNMSANNAPYGTASCSSAYQDSTQAWKSFSGGTWISAYGTTNQWIQYEFVEPIVIKQFSFRNAIDASYAQSTTVILRASNDGVNFVDLGEYADLAPRDFHFLKVNNNDSYLIYRCFIALPNNSYNGGSTRMTGLKFYAWGPKGNVPIMTSNTIPYGTAGASSANTSADKLPYKVFTRNGNNSWADRASAGSDAQRIYYKFTNPINVKKMYSLYYTAGNAGKKKQLKLQYSDDGSTWYDACDYETYTIISGANITNLKVGDNGYHLYWGMMMKLTNADGSAFNWTAYCNELQFYGRELKISVPTMTTNAAPYGTAIGNIRSDTKPTANPYIGFNGTQDSSSTRNYVGINFTDGYIGYRFTTPTVIKAFCWRNNYDTTTSAWNVTGCDLKYSDDGSNWETLQSYSYITPKGGNGLTLLATSEEAGAHKYWAFFPKTGQSSAAYGHSFNFYGLDYSEKEFEVGATKKWLYDHGLELSTFIFSRGSSNSTHVEVSNDGHELMVYSLGGTNANPNNFSLIGCVEDLSTYSLMRTVISERAMATTGAYSIGTYIWNSMPTSTYDANQRVAQGQVFIPISNPNTTNYIDVSSIVGNKTVTFGAIYENGRGGSINEWWLE